MIECRLAKASDDTPENRQRVVDMGRAYCRESLDRSVMPYQLYVNFREYANKHLLDPQFWMVFVDGKFDGFMTTMAVDVDGKTGIQITQGYLDRKYAGRGLSHWCMAEVEKAARENSLKFVNCITRLDPDIYERWIRPAGYRRDYTAFVKEII